MKQVEVVAAVLRDDAGRVFATQRGYGAMKDGWEFPGGKIETGETPEEALKREIVEELNVNIDIDDFLTTVEWDYETFHLTMQCYLCHVVSGEMVLMEHEAARWLPLEEIDSVDWLPADLMVVAALRTAL
ncbi:MAG: (deoxy)nucleoside triphosphate pyrophosphohydrolase [Muribaculaceae bacterium]|nr:(deoxy)nucleoside triphosphate pyrophosphohydrolase [Muribaculaceae bacterium]